MRTSLEEGIKLHRFAGIFPEQFLTVAGRQREAVVAADQRMSSVAFAMISPTSSTMFLIMCRLQSNAPALSTLHSGDIMRPGRQRGIASEAPAGRSALQLRDGGPDHGRPRPAGVGRLQ
jgi:hypothetical protein